MSRPAAPVFIPDGPRGTRIGVGEYFKEWCRAMLADRSCFLCHNVARAFKHIPADMVLCVPCAAREAEEIAARGGAADGRATALRALARLKRCGLDKQDRALSDLGLMVADGKLEDPDAWIRERMPKPPQKARYARSVTALTRYLDSPARGSLVLSGPPGTGKSTAAAFAAWHTHGLYMPRERWSTIDPWDQSEIAWVCQHGGIVVLDEVCVMNGRDLIDRKGIVEVCGLILKGRHAAGRPTVLTTNATRDEFMDAYGVLGEAIWRRAHADLGGDGGAGGFVDVGAA